MFTPLALAVTFAIAASFLIAIFFVPVATAKLMGSRHSDQAGGAAANDEQQPGWLIGGYRNLLLWSLARRGWIALASFGLLIGSAFLMRSSGAELFPPVDSGQFRIYVRAPTGTRIELSEDYVKKVENIIADVVGDPAPDNPAEAVFPVTLEKYDANKNGVMDADEVARAKQDSNCEMLISESGVLMDWPAAYSPNTGPMDSYVMCQLTEHGGKSVFEYVSELRTRLNQELPEVEFAFDTGGILTAALNMGEPSPIHLQVTGYTLSIAHDIADHLVETIESVPGATDVRIAQRIDYPTIRVDMDRVRRRRPWRYAR